MKKIFFLSLLSVLTACATVKLIPPAQSDVERVSSKYPGYSLTDLKSGQALFEQTCNRCHRLKNPASRDEDQWNKIVPKMIQKLNKKEGNVVIDDKQEQSILQYLVTMSGAPKPSK
jgi:cytochrome c5